MACIVKKREKKVLKKKMKRLLCVFFFRKDSVVEPSCFFKFFKNAKYKTVPGIVSNYFKKRRRRFRSFDSFSLEIWKENLFSKILFSKK